MTTILQGAFAEKNGRMNQNTDDPRPSLTELPSTVPTSDVGRQQLMLDAASLVTLRAAIDCLRAVAASLPSPENEQP